MVLADTLLVSPQPRCPGDRPARRDKKPGPRPRHPVRQV